MKSRLRDGSGWRAYRHVTEDTDRHGNVRLYFRRKGRRKIRLLETPGTDAFDEEYQRAFRGEIKPVEKGAAKLTGAPGTMLWLCQQYFGSAVFRALGESTRKVRRGILEAICGKDGAKRYAKMEPRHVARIRDEKADLPEAANARVKALRRLFDWACDPEYKLATANPAKEVKYLKAKNPDGFKEWSEDDADKYEARHPIGTKARLALDLILYTGVRRSDLVRLGPQMERDGKLIFTETKGRGRIAKKHEIPIMEPLRESIDAAPTGHLVYLVTAYGKPHSVKGFGNWFKKRCREAGVDSEISAHGARKLGATRAVERGATEHELMALYGWTTTKQAGVYTRKVNRRRLEAEAAQKLQGPKTNKSVPPSRRVASGGTARGKKR